MRVGVVAGGRTAEAEGSLGSARQLYAALQELGCAPEIVALPATASARWQVVEKLASFDVVIPLITGLEGALALLDIAYVGSSAAAAGIAGHKGVFNDLVARASLRKVAYEYGPADGVLQAWERRARRYPAFVKPARLGASYGITRVDRDGELRAAVSKAAAHDPVIVIELAVPEPFVEYEVALIIGRDILASQPARVAPSLGSRWRDTQSKYSLSTHLYLDAAPGLARRLVTTACACARIAGVYGATRVDMFATPDGTVYVGEINAVPGHGQASTFPRIFELSGKTRVQQVGAMLDSAVWRRDGASEGSYLF